ncbi:hypothetical protein CBR_g18577 [Chara braunii]|uniref:LysM domain-containing protein n=1 Tax=Chara braunii TaxID=69332 RepID=A0A388JT60_CHABU|nr:hypothetical protein CBR_g18577 [Chara braunii]|eukprot:GBG60981.1 hypothetical protein CBR_g18577 [Chara braunii]
MNVDRIGRGAKREELLTMKRLPWRCDTGVERRPGGGVASPLQSTSPSPPPPAPAPVCALACASSSVQIDHCSFLSEKMRRQHDHRDRRWFSSEAAGATAAAGDWPWLPSWTVLVAVLWVLALQALVPSVVGTACSPAADQGCISFAVYRMKRDESLLEVAERYRESVTGVLLVNGLTETATTKEGEEVYIPLRCACDQSQGIFRAKPTYTINKGDTLSFIAQQKYQYMTTIATIAEASSVKNVDFILAGATLTIPIPCACNRTSIPPFAYTSFLTYVPRQGDNDVLLAGKYNSSKEAMRTANDAAQEVNIESNKPIVIPSNKTFPPLTINALPPAQPNCSFPDMCPGPQPEPQPDGNKTDSGKGLPSAVFISLLVGGVIIFILAGVSIAYILSKASKRRRHGRRGVQQGSSITRHFFSRSSAGTENTTGSSTPAADVHGQCGASNVAGFEEPDRMIVFSYNELANATDNFSTANKIGQGAFGTVYYAKLRNRTYCGTAPVELESQVAFSKSCLGGMAKEWVLAEANAAGFEDIGEWAKILTLRQFL